MYIKSMEPFGLALLDFLNGDYSAKVVIHGDDGAKADLPINFFFRPTSDFSVVEQKALDMCQGDVLDVGAGTGLHSIALQDRGLNVCSIDILPEACEIMRKRGLKDVHCINILDFKTKQFDTLLILNNSIGLVGTLHGLDRFLIDIHRLTKIGGQILLDSQNVLCTDDTIIQSYQKKGKPDCYVGEVHAQFEYKDRRGPSFWWLHVDSETLTDHALKTGWHCRIIYKEKSGNYLAQLVPTTS